mgnify:CR=1 FL=1
MPSARKEEAAAVASSGSPAVCAEIVREAKEDVEKMARGRLKLEEHLQACAHRVP